MTTFQRNLVATCLLGALAVYLVSRPQPNNEAAGALVLAIVTLWTHSGRKPPPVAALLILGLALTACSPEFSYHAGSAGGAAPLAGIAGFDATVGTPFTPYSCPAGKVCIFANSTTSPARWRFVAGDGSVVDSGTAIATALVAGTPSGVQTGYIWQDSSIGFGALRYRSVGGSVTLATLADVGAAAPEIWFTRTCSITSAAAATPVTCLADADVPAGKSAYLMGWRAKVNGMTSWTTTSTCSLKDTGGAAAPFFVIPVAAMTGNAFLNDGAAGVTQAAAYSLNQGTAAAKGLVMVCDVNGGAGSTLFVTVFGSIK